MELWVGALNLGFMYAFMTMGVYITFRVHDFPDITVDGSFTAGAGTAAILMVSGLHPIFAVCLAFLAGATAGFLTALIHIRLKINGLLAGILVMTGLYSVNLHIMGRSNIPLLNQRTLFSYLEEINPGFNTEIWTCLALVLVMILFWLIFSFFFRSDLGISMRGTGNNSTMAAATGINVDGMTLFGVALANALTGLSGALVAQYQGFADIGMGIGTIVMGLAAVIIGESVLRIRSMFAIVLSVIIGSVIFRLMIACALYVGMNPIDLKLLTAVFVLVTLIASRMITRKKGKRERFPGRVISVVSSRWMQFSLAGVAVVLLAVIFISKHSVSISDTPAGEYKIGFVQVSDNGLLNVTRDSFVEEMARIGYRQKENCAIMLENANGDLPTVNTILDKFLYEDVDIVVPVSTACTQAAINRIKDRAVVFATVANPFIIKAGKSETDHLPNVTGVYGWVPMDKTLEIVREIMPGKLTIGSIWDPAHANSVFNAEQLESVAEASDDVTFVGVTISGSSDVYQAAIALVIKGIDAFVLPPDNIVYSAFDSVVKAARTKNIPIFLSDVERLADGALGTLGYDYRASGIQAAHLVDRVLKGENPKDIPFERYKKLTIGFNLDVARQIGISIPDSVLDRATMLCEDGNVTDPSADRREKKALALFYFNEHTMMNECLKGVTDELKESGTISKYDMDIDVKCAQGEFSIAQSIAQDIVRRGYDYIITLSTPALQISARVNRKIPHIFGAVTDPYRMGVAENPHKHPGNITGVATLQPVETTIRTMRELYPDAKSIGIVWNPAEACSETCTLKARKAAHKYDFVLMEAHVNATGEVMDAVRSLVNRDIDLFLTSGDNTVLLALQSIANILKKHKIPFFTNTPSDVMRGSLVSVGADYYEVGRKTGQMAVRVIEGESPGEIPINNFVPEKIYVNLELAEHYGMVFPEKFLEKAANIKE